MHTLTHSLQWGEEEEERVTFISTVYKWCILRKKEEKLGRERQRELHYVLLRQSALTDPLSL